MDASDVMRETGLRIGGCERQGVKMYRRVELSGPGEVKWTTQTVPCLSSPYAQQITLELLQEVSEQALDCSVCTIKRVIVICGTFKLKFMLMLFSAFHLIVEYVKNLYFILLSERFHHLTIV